MPEELDTAFPVSAVRSATVTSGQQPVANTTAPPVIVQNLASFRIEIAARVIQAEGPGIRRSREPKYTITYEHTPGTDSPSGATPSPVEEQSPHASRSGAERVLRLLIHPDKEEALIGDLYELYYATILPKYGREYADRWYRRKILWALGYLLIGAIKTAIDLWHRWRTGS